jgi:hypothetical protein
MRPLPWKTSLEPDPEATYLAMASSLPLRRLAATPRFLTFVQTIRRQLADAPGLVGYALWAKPLAKRYWTLSVWTGDDALASFMRTPPHIDVMRRLRPEMNPTRFVQWPVKGSDLPIAWSEAVRRLEAAGERQVNPTAKERPMAHADTERTHAEAKIDVQKYEPSVYDDAADGPALVRIHVEENFAGDIEGSGVAEFLQTALTDSEASFVGVERVTGKLGGRSGSFVFHDQGTLKEGVVSGTWFVVPGSGTGELQGLRGEGGFRAHLGQSADVMLDYWFE